MPDPPPSGDDPDITIPVPGDDDEMAADKMLEDGTSVVVHGMNQSWAASNARRIDGADALAEFVRLGHDARRDRLNQADAFAFRVATEAGSGRTRVEARQRYMS